MKQLLIFLLFPIIFGTEQTKIEETTPVWNTDYTTTLKKAAKSNKRILVYFTGSDWCGPCKELKKDLFETIEFKEIAKDYELLYIDIPRQRNIISNEQMKHNMDLMVQLNKKGVFPNLKVLNKKGEEIGALTGYSMDGKIRKHLRFLKKHID